jgi:hypothetical protein
MKNPNENDGRIVVKKLKPISAVAQVYSGRPGCACGCLGKYYPVNEEETRNKGYWTKEDEVNKKDNFAKNKKMLTKVYRLFEQNLASGKIYSWAGSLDKFVVFNKSEDRTYTIYYKDGV